MSEARKFWTHFCLANQFIAQLTPKVRVAVLGNAGSLVVFNIAGTDAEALAMEFSPVPPAELADQLPFRAWMRR